MTPFHPRAAAIDVLVRGGRLGALRFARAAFTGVLDRANDHRWRPDMGGGALLDVGVYCVAPLLAAAGRPPVRVTAAASMAASGVDASFSGWLDFGDGFTAAIECSFEAPERQSLEIVGTEAAVLVDRAFTPGPEDVAFTVRGRDGRSEEIVAGGADPYRAMIEHVRQVVRDGTTPRRSVADAVAVLAVVDRLREAAGLGAQCGWRRDGGPAAPRRAASTRGRPAAMVHSCCRFDARSAMSAPCDAGRSSPTTRGPMMGREGSPRNHQPSRDRAGLPPRHATCDGRRPRDRRIHHREPAAECLGCRPDRKPVGHRAHRDHHGRGRRDHPLRRGDPAAARPRHGVLRGA